MRRCCPRSRAWTSPLVASSEDKHSSRHDINATFKAVSSSLSPSIDYLLITDVLNMYCACASLTKIVAIVGLQDSTH